MASQELQSAFHRPQKAFAIGGELLKEPIFDDGIAVLLRCRNRLYLFKNAEQFSCVIINLDVALHFLIGQTLVGIGCVFADFAGKFVAVAAAALCGAGSSGSGASGLLGDDECPRLDGNQFFHSGIPVSGVFVTASACSVVCKTVWKGSLAQMGQLADSGVTVSVFGGVWIPDGTASNGGARNGEHVYVHCIQFYE